MGIDGINGTLAAPSLAGAGLGNGTPARRSAAPTSAEPPAPTEAPAARPNDKPAPLRFPWLSRLSSELGAAAKSPAPFSAPVLGDHVDKQA